MHETWVVSISFIYFYIFFHGKSDLKQEAARNKKSEPHCFTVKYFTMFFHHARLLFFVFSVFTCCMAWSIYIRECNLKNQAAISSFFFVRLMFLDEEEEIVFWKIKVLFSTLILLTISHLLMLNVLLFYVQW